MSAPSTPTVTAAAAASNGPVSDSAPPPASANAATHHDGNATAATQRTPVPTPISSSATPTPLIATSSATPPLPPTAPASASTSATQRATPATATTAVSPSTHAPPITISSIVLPAVTQLAKLATSKRMQRIRQECAAIIKHLQELEKKNQQSARAGGGILIEYDADQYFLVFKLACDTGVSKLMSVSLDAVWRLMSVGFLTGHSPIDPRLYPNPNPHMSGHTMPEEMRKVSAAVTKAMAEGPVSDGAHEGEEEQQQHEQHVNGDSQDVAGTTTPSATSPSSTSSSTPSSTPHADLSFSNLTGLPPSHLFIAGGSDGKLMSVMMDTFYTCSQYKDTHVQQLVLKCVLTAICSPTCSVHGWSLLQALTTCFHIYLHNASSGSSGGSAAEETNRVTAKAALNHIVHVVFARMEMCAAQIKQIQDALHAIKQKEQEQMQLQTPSIESTPDPALSPINSPSSDSSSTASASAATPAPPTPGRHGLCVICGRTANYRCVHSHVGLCGMECKIQHLQRIDPSNQLSASLRRKLVMQLELFQNDAFYLLKALCRLAVKTLPPSSSTDSKDINSVLGVESKLLSLQLLLAIVSNAGCLFRSSKHFIHVVKVDLVNCLLRNSAASSIDSIFAISSACFVALIAHFKPHLHAVIGSLLESIYLPYIHSPNSSFEHKYISLSLVHKLCLEPHTLIEIFISYDCDMASLGNTFQKIANTLERVCRTQSGPECPSWLSATEEMKLKRLALEGMVDTMQSLLTWTKKAQVNLMAAKEAAEAQAILDQTAAASSHAAHGEDSDDEGGESTRSTRNHARHPSRASNGHVISSSASTPSAASTPSNDSRALLDASTSSQTPVGGGSSAAFSMHQFHAARAQRQKLDTGILKFNMKPKKGLAYLASHGLVDAESAESVAEFFLHNANQLDKVQVGEFMGDDAAFNKSVLYAYTERLNFHGLAFDAAIRSFLQGFWLPGEAQKIDRMMEKFAEQYHKHNPGTFSSADTAYVLAYSVILLNTDAHSPMVKHRMTKEDFFKNCRGIDDGKDIDPVFLGSLYDRIVSNEIKMSDSGSRARMRRGSTSHGSSKRENRFHMFMAESQELVQKTQDYLENYSRKHEQQEGKSTDGGASSSTGGSDSTDGSSSRRRLSRVDMGDDSRVFYQATDKDVEAVRPMFEILWYPSLATFSVLLEEHEYEDGAGTHISGSSSSTHNANGARVIELCLNGYRHAIRLSSMLGMETSRLAFVTSLRKFTLLGSTREMKMKNIEAIKLLLHIAHSEGNTLKESWLDVLQVISELERLHLFASSRPVADVFQSTPSRTRESDSINSQHINKIDAASIDRVFTSSAHLDSDAIVDFVSALRSVSEHELSNVSAPRVFSLTKIVEVTYYNMGRIRVVWSKIWSVLSGYFVAAGTHPNLNVSMYAIDSLRQLAMKFLERNELAQYHFQRSFFKPFELIMQTNTTNEARELIVQCCRAMVASRVNNIKSGWKGVFVVIHTAAGSSHQALVSAAFDLIATILDHHWDLLTTTTSISAAAANSNDTVLDECVNALVSFGTNNFTNIALKAIHYIQLCANHLGMQQQERREKRAQKIAAAAAQQQQQQQESETPSTDLDRTPSRSRKSSASASAAPSPIHTVGADSDNELDIGLLSPSPIRSTNTSNSDVGADGVDVAYRDDMRYELKIWFLALTGLSRMVGDGRVEVRTRALVALFKILQRHGHLFSAAMWRAVWHGVLMPIFDDVTHATDQATRGSSRKHTATGTPMQGANGSVTPPTKEEEAQLGKGGESDTVPSDTNRWRHPIHWSWPVNGTPKQIAKLTSTTRIVSPSPIPIASPIPTAAHASTPTGQPIVPVTTTPPPVRTMPSLPPKPPGSAPTNRLPTMPPPTAPTAGQRALPNTRPPHPPSSSAHNASNHAAAAADSNWLQTTCFSALSTLVELFDHFYASISFLFIDLLDLLQSCIVHHDSDEPQTSELARIGIKCLVLLLSRCGAKLSVQHWWTALERCAEITQRTMPVELMSHRLMVALGLIEQDATGTGQQQMSPPHTSATAASMEQEEAHSQQHSSRPGSRASSRKPSTDTTNTSHADQSGSSNHADGTGNSDTPAAARPRTGSLYVNVNTPTSATSTHPASTTTGPSSSVPPSPSRPTVSVSSSLPSSRRPSFSVSTPSPSPLPPAPTPAPALAPAPTPVNYLPLNVGGALIKCKIQLWMLDALFQVLDAFFPNKKIEKERDAIRKEDTSNRTEKEQQQEEKVDGDADVDASFHVSLSSNTHDDSVLGHLTCEQLFFGLDILCSSLSFSRAFNLNVRLRRRLYDSGFQTEQTMQGRLPQLFLQETRATRLYVHLLCRLLREASMDESEEAERRNSMDGEKWMRIKQHAIEHDAYMDDPHAHTFPLGFSTEAGGVTPVQSSYAAYVALGELRFVSLSLRFLAAYVQKTISGQLVSLEFSDELLCAFLSNLLHLSSVSSQRFQAYCSIFYHSLVQLIAFGKENIRHQLALLFQQALPNTLKMHVADEGANQKFPLVNAVPIPTYPTPNTATATNDGDANHTATGSHRTQ